MVTALPESLFGPLSFSRLASQRDTFENPTLVPKIVLLIDSQHGMVRALITIPLTDREVVSVSPDTDTRDFPLQLELTESAAAYFTRKILKEHGLKWSKAHQFWEGRPSLGDLRTLLSRMHEAVEVRAGGTIRALAQGVRNVSIKLNVNAAGGDWYEVDAALDGGNDVTLDSNDLFLLKAGRGEPVCLGAKGYFALNVEEATAQAESLGFKLDGMLGGEKERLHTLHFSEKSVALVGEESRDRIIDRAMEIAAQPTPVLPSAIKAELRPYQRLGFEFLANRTAVGLGPILADDMGLGKTLQTISWWQWISERSEEKPTLIVCPKSVAGNWIREFGKFLPEAKVTLWNPKTGIPAGKGIVVMNYGAARVHAKTIGKVRWLAVVLDEAQFIKNPKSMVTKAVCSLVSDYRLALTGTPIENHLMDLWSITNFATPGLLGTEKAFKKNYPDADSKARRRLAARIRPLILRRTKSEVDIDLPERVEEDLVVEMAEEQGVLYRAEAQRAREMLQAIRENGQFDGERFNVLSALLRLRQICCHPVLANPEHAAIESSKTESILETVEPIVEEGQKVLIFSQFTSLIDVITEDLTSKGIKVFTITGQTDKREAVIEAFDSHEGGAVFLISLKSGGFGINLTKASYVVIADPWWNPAAEAQAIDRAHRIGQTKKVIAYRFIMKDTVEERIRKMQASKAQLAADILTDNAALGALTLEDFECLFAA